MSLLKVDLESSFCFRRKCFNVCFMGPRDNHWLIGENVPRFKNHIIKNKGIQIIALPCLVSKWIKVHGNVIYLDFSV